MQWHFIPSFPSGNEGRLLRIIQVYFNQALDQLDELWYHPVITFEMIGPIDPTIFQFRV